MGLSSLTAPPTSPKVLPSPGARPWSGGAGPPAGDGGQRPSSAEPTVDLQLRQFEWEDPTAGLLAIMAEDHPLASRGTVSARRLAREPFLESRIVSDGAFARHWYLRDLRGPSAPAVLSSARTVEEWLGEVALRRCVNLVPEGVADAAPVPPPVPA